MLMKIKENRMIYDFLQLYCVGVIVYGNSRSTVGATAQDLLFPNLFHSTIPFSVL